MVEFSWIGHWSLISPHQLLDCRRVHTDISQSISFALIQEFNEFNAVQ